MISKDRSGVFSGFFRKSDSVLITDHLILSIENTLLALDILYDTVSRIMLPIRQNLNRYLSHGVILSTISDEMIKIFEQYDKPLEIDLHNKPQVMLVCGINGVGKTSTIGKMAYTLTKHNWHVTVGMCDTFRAAANDQLRVTIDRHIKNNIVLIGANKDQENPSAVVYRAYDEAKKHNSDILIIDTAGRLYNHVNLMNELSGICRTLTKKNIAAPHNIILIIDGTTGKDAIRQVEEFGKIGKISGIVVTKLDYFIKCGILLSIVDKFGITIHGVSNGENIDDLHDFVPRSFIKTLLTKNNNKL